MIHQSSPLQNENALSSGLNYPNTVPLKPFAKIPGNSIVLRGGAGYKYA